MTEDSYGSVRPAFELSFDGPAVRGGTIDVRILGPTMFAIDGLFTAANQVLNGPSVTMNVVVGTPKPGSFMLPFDILSEVVGVTQTVMSAWDVLGRLFDPSSGVLPLHLRVRDQEPSIRPIDPDLFEIEAYGERYIVPLEVLRLFESRVVRQYLLNLLTPLGHDGINEFRVADSGKEVLSVSKYDYMDWLRGAGRARDSEGPGLALPLRSAPYRQELLSDQTTLNELAVVAPVFRKGGRWRLSDGRRTYSVAMKDGEFLQRVIDNGEAFGMGDTLLCDFRTVQRETRGGIRTLYEITQVWEHRKSSR